MLIDLDNIQVPIHVDESGLNAFYFKAYHCTRGFADDIKLHGLKCFNVEERLDYVQRKLVQPDVPLKLINEYFFEVRQYLMGMQLEGRSNIVCFCLNRNILESERDFGKLFLYFGGEAIYRVAENSQRFPEIRAALVNIGTPLLVTARINLVTTPGYQRKNVMKFLNGESRDECEIFIQESVDPENIISVEIHK